MKRALPLVGAFLFVGSVFLFLLAARINLGVRSDQDSPRGSFSSVVTNTVAFAKSRLTGGVGVLIQVDPATGYPKIHAVVPGSPAEQAGLRPLDHILEIDGVTTIGQPLEQNVEKITGVCWRERQSFRPTVWKHQHGGSCAS